METTKPIQNNFAKDLLFMQADLGKIDFLKNAEGTTGARSYKYIDLPTLLKQVKPVLVKHYFVWYTAPGYTDNGEPTLEYTLAHISGNVIRGTMLLQLKSADPQAQGSAITYARRYALTAVLDIAADDDDDASKAQAETKVAEAAAIKPLNDNQRKRITQFLTKLGMTEEAYQTEKLNDHQIDSLTADQAAKVIKNLENLVLQAQNKQVK